MLFGPFLREMAQICLLPPSGNKWYYSVWQINVPEPLAAWLLSQINCNILISPAKRYRLALRFQGVRYEDMQQLG